MFELAKSLTAGWKLRLLVMVVIGGWIVGSPAYRQIYKGRSKWFPRWVMFHGYGRNLCDVKYYSAAEDGSLQLLDRYEVLDRERSWTRNRSFMRLKRIETVKSVGRQLCNALGDEADVRAWARCGSQGKWRTKLRTKKNLCEKSIAPPVKSLRRRLK